MDTQLTESRSIYQIDILEKSKILPLMIAMTDAGTAYKMFINGKLVAAKGKVGSNANDSKPFMKHEYFAYDPDSTSLNIVIHVSNFHYVKSGLWDNITFGTREELSMMFGS
jgi:two-component system sensor histidine kinase ChiS